MLKSKDLKDPEKQAGVEELLGPLGSDKMAQLVAISKLITDWVRGGTGVHPCGCAFPPLCVRVCVHTCAYACACAQASFCIDVCVGGVGGGMRGCERWFVQGQRRACLPACFPSWEGRLNQPLLSRPWVYMYNVNTCACTWHSIDMQAGLQRHGLHA